MNNRQIMHDAAKQQHMMQQRSVPQNQEFEEDNFEDQQGQGGAPASEMNDLVSSVPEPTVPRATVPVPSVQPSKPVPSAPPMPQTDITSLLFEPVVLILLMMIFFHPTTVSMLKLDTYLGSLGDENTFTMNLGKRILAVVALYFLIKSVYGYFFQKN
jgi:hypothetical protein